MPKPPRTSRGEHRQARWQWNLLLGIAVTAASDDWRMDFRPRHDAVVSMAFVRARRRGADFLRRAILSRRVGQLKVGSSNMDTLVALGSTTAFGYSAWALFSGRGRALYFMEAAAIITLISLGHWLEARVSDKAGGALKSLLNLAPQTARRIQIPSQKPTSGGQFNSTNASFSNSRNPHIGNPQLKRRFPFPN